jgi:hypothetical protein
MDIIKKLNKLDLHYHNFADKDKYTDILTNLPILIAGLYILSYKNQKLKVLGIHVILLSIASSYYHINPNNNTILIDLLSISLISSLLIMYLLNIRNNYIKILLYLLSIGTVLYWKYSSNLLPYSLFWLSVTILLLYKYYDTKYKYKSLLIVGLIIAIRIVEIYDKQIYKLTNNILSGHSLKHILAGIGIYLIANLLNESKLV